MQDETIKDIVLGVLKGSSEEKIKAKDDDNWLVLAVLMDMGFATKINNKIFIKYDLVDSMPSFEAITRARRKIAEEGKNFASEETKKKRAKAQVDYQKHYSSREPKSDCMKGSNLIW